MRLVLILFAMVVSNAAMAQITFGPADDGGSESLFMPGDLSSDTQAPAPTPAPTVAPPLVTPEPAVPPPAVTQPQQPQVPAPAPVVVMPPAPAFPQCSAGRMTKDARLASQMIEAVLHVRGGASATYRNPIDSDKNFELHSSRGELMATVRGSYVLPASICQRDGNRVFVKIDASQYGYGAFYVTAQSVDSRRVRIVPSTSTGAPDYSGDQRPAIYHVIGASR